MYNSIHTKKLKRLKKMDLWDSNFANSICFCGNKRRECICEEPIACETCGQTVRDESTFGSCSCFSKIELEEEEE